MVIKFVSVKTLLEEAEVKPPEPIIGGLLFRKSMAVLGAPEDSFKTHLTLQLAISIAAGIDFSSYSCKKAIVVYLVLEGGTDYILQRIEEKIEALNLNRDEVMSRLFVMDAAGLQLDNQVVIGEINKALAEMEPKPDVVIFDPITYASSEDVRLSPEKQQLCKNMMAIAAANDGVALAVIHCRKDAKANDNMDDFLGSGQVARMAATRIKLYRDGDNVYMFTKTRYSERQDPIRLVWKPPLLETTEEVLKPREEVKRSVIQLLKAAPPDGLRLGNLVTEVAKATRHNEKTVRAVLSNLEVDEKIDIKRLPKSATKLVKLVTEETLHAS